MIPRTLQRILTESVDPAEAPAVAPPRKARRAFLEALGRAAGGDEIFIGSVSGEPQRSVKVIVDTPVEERFGNPFRERVVIAFHGDRLFVAADHILSSSPREEENAVPLAGAAQLRRVVAALRAHLQVQARHGLKRQKLRKLWERALEGKIEAMARRMGLCFSVEWFTDWLRLGVDLDRDEAIFFEVGYRRADAALADAERAVTEVRRLRAEGLRFTIRKANQEMMRRPK